MLRDSIDMVIRWRSNFGNTKDPSETTYRKVLQFPHGRMDSLAEKDSITIGPRASCARHDITLPGHIKTNVITLEICSNYHIWPRFIFDWCQDTSDSGCLTWKRCDTIWRDGVARYSRSELWKQVSNHEFIIKPRRGWGGGWWTQRQSIESPKRCISKIRWTRR